MSKKELFASASEAVSYLARIGVKESNYIIEARQGLGLKAWSAIDYLQATNSKYVLKIKGANNEK